MAHTIDLEVIGFNAASRHFSKLPGVVAKAERRALKRTSAWAKSQGLRAMSQESRITQKALKQSLRAFASVDDDGSARIWFGASPIRAAYVGKLVQQKRGAKAGRHKFPGGFVATMKSGHTGIYMRRGKSRLPIDEQTVDVVLPDAEFQRIAQESQSRLMTQFHHDLEWYAGRIK